MTYAPVVVCYGGGTNSTAMLIGLHERGERPDLILFADTGGEKPHTYRHVEEVSAWCGRAGFPTIVTVQSQDRDGRRYTLEQRCLDHRMLPSIAYGFKACSEKHKRRPQDKYVNGWEAARLAWAAGLRVTKLIGYDADEERRARISSDVKYAYRYPLIEWGWGRHECMEAIKRAGLPQPGKSACFFCPSSKKEEILDLKRRYPDLLERALAMEDAAIEHGAPCSLCDGGRNPIGDIEDSLHIGGLPCPRCDGTLREPSSIRGLGRNFSWRLFLNGDPRQAHLFPPDIACDCYDGDEREVA